MGKPVVVAIVGDNRGLNKSLGESESRMSKFGKVGKAAMLGFAGGAAAAAVGAFKLVQGAAEDEQAAALLAKQLKNSARATKGQVAATEEWISKQGKLLGVTDDELRPALGELVRSTKDVGKAQKLSSLAMDISAGTGKDLKTVSLALARANNGQVAGLSRLGIKTKDAEGKTKSFTQIQKELSREFGGAASTKANTFAGKMDRLKLMLSEAGETLGANLLPPLTDFATWIFDKGVPAAQKLGQEVSERLGPFLAKVGDFIKDKLIPAIKPLVRTWLESLRKGFENLSKKLGDAKPFLDLLEAGFRGLWQVFSKVLLPVLGQAYKIIIPALGTALGVVATTLGKVGEVGKFMWNNVLAPVFRFMANAIGTALDLLGKMFSALGKVPKMGWAKDLGRDLGEAADKARGMAGEIKNIPSKKDVKVNVAKGTGWGIFGELAALGEALANLKPKGGRTSRTVAPVARSVSAAGLPSSSLPINITLTAEAVDQLTRGREIRADLDAWDAIGGRVLVG